MAGFTVGSVLIGIFSDRYLFRSFFYFLYITFKERGLNLDLKSFWYDFCCIFRFGRKLALMSSIVLYIGSNVSLSFVQEFLVFAALRFVSGVSVGGLLSTCYVMGKDAFLYHSNFKNWQFMRQASEELIMYNTCNFLTFKYKSMFKWTCCKSNT